MWQQVVLAISEVLRSPRLCSNQDPVLLCFFLLLFGHFHRLWPWSSRALTFVADAGGASDSTDR